MKLTIFTIYFLRIYLVIAMIYWCIVCYYSGIKTSFAWFWPVSACGALVLSLLLSRFGALSATEHPRLHISVLAVCFLFWTCILWFFITECVLLRTAAIEPPAQVEYVIVLGAQVRGTVPSLTLQKRIDLAASYLLTHPTCIAICSGGMGNGELISEAEAIYRGLTQRGVDGARLRMESASTSTEENLLFSMNIIQNEDASVLLITSGFHCYRAGLLAQKAGYKNVATYGATEMLPTTPQYYVREFLALWHNRINGRI